MNIFNIFEGIVCHIITDLSEGEVLPKGLDLDRITATPPRDPAHGDIATNAAMILAKQAGMKPRDIAAAIKTALEDRDEVDTVEIAGPGFINIRLVTNHLRDRLTDILIMGTAYGDSTFGGGRPVNIEYVSANPTGPLHAAHARGAVVGDALAVLLAKIGYDVTREYYVNDAGGQIDILARSAYLRYLEALGEDIGEIPKGLYPGEYLKPVGETLATVHGDIWRGKDESEWLAPVRDFALSEMMGLIRKDLALLGIVHDHFTFERDLVASGAVESALTTLEERNLLYQGVPEPPKGKTPDGWEAREQTLFRATDYGDDVDRPIKKSDGGWTYFATDIAYHLDKFRRGALDLIDVWGADHGGYVKRMHAAVRALTEGEAELDVKICQIVHMMDGGQPVRMSKRAGNFVTLRDVICAVGRDVVRFIMLTRRNDQTLEFDFKKVTEQSRDNPVFYVQYAHARCRSVLRHAKTIWPGHDLTADALAEADLTLLEDEAEMALVRKLIDWPRTVLGAATAHEPHRIAFYLHDLAGAFHVLWTRGRDDADLRFLIEEEPDLSFARLALVKATQIVLSSGLSVMGVIPVEEMR